MRWFCFGAELYLGVAMLTALWILKGWNGEGSLGHKVAVYGGIIWPWLWASIAYLILRQMPMIWHSLCAGVKECWAKEMQENKDQDFTKEEL